MICDRYTDYCHNRARKTPEKDSFNLKEWMQSLEEHSCEDNRQILEAIKDKNKEEMYFALEHLIHLRCDLTYCRLLIGFVREVEWM